MAISSPDSWEGVTASMREFLESSAPLKSYRKQVSLSDVAGLPEPPIRAYCKNCQGDQTFTGFRPPHSFQWLGSQWPGVWVGQYLCAGCKDFGMAFLLEVRKDGSAIKLGQSPVWEQPLAEATASALGPVRAALYRKGIQSEAAGFGIGALAYYRRIIEDIIDELLALIPRLLPESDKERFQRALGDVSNAKTAADKIELVKDLLPEILKPDGVNPLHILFEAFSEGIHTLPDDECLEVAVETREALLFSLDRLTRGDAARRAFTDAMRKLLERRAKRGVDRP